MVLYTLWNGRKSFDYQLINCISWYKNTEALSKLGCVDPKSLFDSFGRTLLHYAVACKNPDIVQYLIDRGCEIDAKDNIGTTPLICAMQVTSLPMIQILLSAKANIFSRNQLGQSPLEMALAHRGYLQVNIVTEFLNAVKRECSDDCMVMAKLLIANNCSLPQTMFLDDAKLTEQMLNNGCNVDDHDFDNFTALHYAVQRTDLDNVKLLVAHGADVNSWNNRAQSPLHVYNFKSTSMANLEILRLLLDRGACLADCDDADYTVTRRFFRYGKVADVKILLEYDVDMFERNGEGSSLLHLAARNSNFNVIRLFHGKRFDVNAQDKNGNTALWYAAEFANWAAFEFLLQHGADVSLKDNEGNTTLYKCFSEWCEMDYEMKRCLKCAELLLQYRPNCTSVGLDLEMIILDLLLEKRHFQLAKPVLAYLAVRNAVGENFLSKLDCCKKLRRYYNACVRKTEEMKRTVVYESVTLFKFLIESDEQLVCYARNQKAAAKLQELLTKQRRSTLYVVKALRRRITTAVKTATLRKKSALGLSRIKGLHCNWDVIDNIISFLDSESLRNVSRIGNKWKW